MHDVSLETGVSVFEYWGDVYASPPTLETLISDLTWAEWGYFFEKQDGTVRWLDRSYVAENYTVQATLTSADVLIAP